MKRSESPEASPGARLAAYWERWCAQPEAVACSGMRGADPVPSIRSLLPGISALPAGPPHGRQLLVVAASTHPLSAWPVVLHGLSAGWRVEVKASRHAPEGLLALAESLGRVAPDWAARFSVGTDSEDALAAVESVDAVVAYGSDATISLFRKLAAGRPFLGFGHAVSFAVWNRGTREDASRLWRDVLVCDQGGCLSPQAVLVEGDPSDVAGLLVETATEVADALGIAARVDPSVVGRLRDVRDTLAAAGARVHGDPGWRWTVVEPPEGWGVEGDSAFGVLPVVACSQPSDARRLLGRVAGHITGIAFTRGTLESARGRWAWSGATRIDAVGSLQSPPLDWRNGGVDVADWLRNALSSQG